MILYLDMFSFDFDVLLPKVDAYCGLGPLGEFTHAKTECETSFSYVGIAEDDDFKYSLLLFRRGPLFHRRTVHRRHLRPALEGWSRTASSRHIGDACENARKTNVSVLSKLFGRIVFSKGF